jgi:7-cyano-7-deazaguanine reductase
MADLTSGLKALGSKETEYRFGSPSPEMLETFPNPSPYPYLIAHVSEEFTSLCPKTGQPDFATITLQYQPKDKCVETKSLKLYLFAYREERAFMEQLCNRIADDLITILEPRYLLVRMVFGPRGGIATKVERKFMDPHTDWALFVPEARA